jgi:Flp pilus assembly protein TadB
LSAALAHAAAAHPPLREAVGPVLGAVERGRSLVDALDEQRRDARLDGDAPPTAAIRLALSVVGTSAQLGGPAAAPLERVATTLRVRSALVDEQRAQSAQAELSARVLTFVPLGLLGLLIVTDANVRAALGTPAGVAVVSIGGILNLAGWRWMRHIVGSPR